MAALVIPLLAPSISARATASESAPAAFSIGKRAEAMATALRDDYSLQLAFSIWILALLSGTALGLRIWCKHIRQKKLWWDDHFLIASWVRCSCHSRGSWT